MQRYFYPLLLLSFLPCTRVPAQSFFTPACGETFFDNGGSGDYTNGQSTIYQVCPQGGNDFVAVEFTAFSFENDGGSCLDGIRLYDGANVSAPVINSPSSQTDLWCWDRADNTPAGGGDLQNFTVIPLNAQGCLTIEVTTNGSGTRPGFSATVSCFTAATGPSVSLLPPGEGEVAADMGFISGDDYTYYGRTVGEDEVELMVGIEQGGSDMHVSISAVKMVTGKNVVNLGTSTVMPAPYTNQPDWYLMPRTWEVDPISQPSSPVEMRVFVSPQELDAVRAAAGLDNLALNELSFYVISEPGEADFMTLAGNDNHQLVLPQNYREFDPGNYDVGISNEGLLANMGWGEITLSSFSSGGAGYGSGAAGALPLEFGEVSGRVREKDNLLEWTTLSETGTESFTVERSSEGQKWQNIGGLSAAGDSKITMHYEFADRNPLSSAYYRLRVRDLDGSEQLSGVVELVRRGDQFRVFPNPTTSVLEVILPQEHGEDGKLSVFTATGKLVERYRVDSGTKKMTINATSWPTGIYLIRMDEYVQKVSKL